nr:MAG TPA: hypothetical protein [Caudoviricetes sp.]
MLPIVLTHQTYFQFYQWKMPLRKIISFVYLRRKS